MGRKSEKILKQEDEQPLLKDVVYRYLDKLRTMHRRVTVAKYEGQFRNYIIPEFGDKHVDEISTHDIISFAYNLLVGSKALSPKTIHEINALMGRIRRFSILHGYEIRYATDCIELPTKAKKISILTTKDEEKLLSYLKDNFNLTSMGILLSLLCIWIAEHPLVVLRDSGFPRYSWLAILGEAEPGLLIGYSFFLLAETVLILKPFVGEHIKLEVFWSWKQWKVQKN